MPTTQSVDTLIIGGGQAGLSLSYYLTQQGREHVVLERKPHLAEAWRAQRWDSFCLNTPNWHLRLPGFPYQGDPDGFLPRAGVVTYIEQYAAHFGAPVQFGVTVAAVEAAERGGYRVAAEGGGYEAQNVVVASGFFQRPKAPPFAAQLPAGVYQLHSSEYRNPHALPPGAVLVVGTGQSGCQIGEELYLAGRKVYLSVGSAGRLPRRYRGRDITWWLDQNGFYDRTMDKMPSPRARFTGTPHLTGKDGGRTLNLHQFARDGVTLVGRLIGAADGKAALAPDLNETLAKIDQGEAEAAKGIDEFIAKNGLDAPPEQLPILRDGYQDEVLTELDLQAADIGAVLWAGGYNFDYSWVRFDIFDEFGYPIQERGATRLPGLYFLGQNGLHTLKSGIFLGIGADAAHVAAHLAGGR